MTTCGLPRQLGAIAFALAVAVTGCGHDGDTAASGSVRGRAFLSESVTEDGATRPLVAGTRIRLQFAEDGQITASAGCNTLGGAVDITADRIDVGDLSTTDMGCDPALHEQDEWLADFLASDPGYVLEGVGAGNAIGVVACSGIVGVVGVEARRSGSGEPPEVLVGPRVRRRGGIR